jgi:hypothetical protein
LESRKLDSWSVGQLKGESRSQPQKQWHAESRLGACLSTFKLFCQDRQLATEQGSLSCLKAGKIKVGQLDSWTVGKEKG